MATYDQVIRAKQHKRATELFQQNLTTKQIAARTGLSTRAVLRLKKKLETQDVEAQHAQVT
jgi:DNA-directed RNA polymerase specialized sigma subunit